MMEAFDARLGLIEREVRRIADSLTLLVRLDERMTAYQTKQDDHEGRIRALEASGGTVGHTVGAWRKAFWIVLSAAAGFGFSVAERAITTPPVTAPALPYHPAPDLPKHEGE